MDLSSSGGTTSSWAKVQDCWLAIGAPAAEVGHVAEAAALHVFVGDLDDEFGAERFPGEVLALAPTALAAGHAVFAGG